MYTTYIDSRLSFTLDKTLPFENNFILVRIYHNYYFNIIYTTYIDFKLSLTLDKTLPFENNFLLVKIYHNYYFSIIVTTYIDSRLSYTLDKTRPQGTISHLLAFTTIFWKLLQQYVETIELNVVENLRHCNTDLFFPMLKCLQTT